MLWPLMVSFTLLKMWSCPSKLVSVCYIDGKGIVFLCGAFTYLQIQNLLGVYW